MVGPFSVLDLGGKRFFSLTTSHEQTAGANRQASQNPMKGITTHDYRHRDSKR